MKLKETDTLKHRSGSKQWEDQIARITGNTTHKAVQKAPPQRRTIQRITTQRGTDRD